MNNDNLDTSVLFDALLDLSPVLVLFLDQEDRVVKISRDACMFLGSASRVEAEGKNVFDLITFPVLRLLAKRWMSALGRGEEINESFPLVLPDGKMFNWFSLRASTIVRDGKIVGKVFIAQDISELSLQKNILDSLASSLPVSVAVFDRNLTLIMGTEELARECGLTSWTGLTGKNLADLPGIDVPLIKRMIEDLILNERPVVRTLKTNAPDGSIRWYHADLRIIRSSAGVYGYILTKQDITGQIQPRAILESLMDTSADLIAIVNPEGRLMYASQALARMTGVSSWHILIGHEWQYIFANMGAKGKRYHDFFEALTEGAPQKMITMDLPDRRQVLSCRVNNLSYQDEPFGAVAMASNLTELVEARERAEDAVRAKAVFLANMTHELRTPMNAVIGMNELLSRTSLAPLQRNYVSHIRSSATLLLAIIGDILDFSRIEAKKMILNPQPFSTLSLVRDVINLVAVKVNEKELSFTVDLDPSLPDTLIGDETRIKQVFINLLNNAVKFTKKGSVSLTLMASPSNNKRNISLTVMVKDTGIGIPRERQAELFKEFSRIEGSSSSPIEGSGLGLSICKGLVTLMGGELDLESEEGLGTTFTARITLPFGKLARPLAEFPDSRDIRLLVFERDDAAVRSIRAMTRAAGAEAIYCTSADEFSAWLSRPGFDRTHVIFEYSSAYQLVLNTADTLPGVSWLALLSLSDFLGSGKDPRVSFVFKPLLVADFARFLRGEGVDFTNSLPMTSTLGVPSRYFHARDVKALVVDDNAVNRKVAEGFLTALDIQVGEADSGEAALKKAAEKQFDLVLMDDVMPGMSGSETTVLMRKLKGYQDTPIIALSANAGEEFEKRYRDAGMTDTLTKPIEFDSFVHCLRRWIPEERVTDVDTGDACALPVEQAKKDDTWIEGLDREVGLSYTGSEKNLEMILKVFIRTGPSLMEKLESAHAGGDPAVLRIAVHSLISACANIGAMEVSSLAREAESAILKGDTEAVHTLYVRLHDALKTVLSGVGAYITKANAGKPEGTT